ncbi:hypothetical protein QC762_300005 [Podospora pseudocomata]|uniref:C2H2-type domain-containing protein n=1 Tax=Podospora pseudocomata TaxID=2093779 RepID=A0ABR0GHE6_9PEZI|nr:hypothetical protein QC762_300005 [Podospora pseudocomata]
MTLPEQWPTGRQYVPPHQCHTTPSELAVKTTSTAPTHIVNTKEYYNQCGIYFHDNLTVDDNDEQKASEGFALDFVPLSLPAAPAPITPERQSTLPTKALPGNKPPSGNKTLPGTKPINKPSTGNGPRARSSSPSPETKTSPGKPRWERLVRSPQPCARSTCGTAFASRNQLFTHLHETGYTRPEAILPPMPPSPTPM